MRFCRMFRKVGLYRGSAWRVFILTYYLALCTCSFAINWFLICLTGLFTWRHSQSVRLSLSLQLGNLSSSLFYYCSSIWYNLFLTICTHSCWEYQYCNFPSHNLIWFFQLAALYVHARILSITWSDSGAAATSRFELLAEAGLDWCLLHKFIWDYPLIQEAEMEIVMETKWRLSQ